MSKQSLLLVDGDTRSLRVLEVSLRKAGFTVTPAHAVEDALDKLELHAPDLIISETTFPDGDGFDLRRRVRATPDWADIPFVFLTASAAIENKIRGLELGVDDYLTKPIYIKEIVTRINILLQKRQRTRFEERRDGRTRFAGRVADMPVVDVIQTIEISRKSGVIQFTGDGGRQAAIYFRDGKVIDAEADALAGEDAVYRLLTWSDGEFEVVFRTVRRRDAITTSSQGLLMEGMRRLDEWTRLLEQLPPLTHRFEIDTAELVSRLGEVPDEHNLILRLIDGKRSLHEVIDAGEFGDLEALQAISRLYFEGLLIDLDHDAPVRRDTGRPMPLVQIEDVSPFQSLPETEEVAAFRDDERTPIPGGDEPPPLPQVHERNYVTEPQSDDAVPHADAALLGGYRHSSLRLIDEAVAAAQAIEPSLFDGSDDAPGAVETAQREARARAQRESDDDAEISVEATDPRADDSIPHAIEHDEPSSREFERDALTPSMTFEEGQRTPRELHEFDGGDKTPRREFELGSFDRTPRREYSFEADDPTPRPGGLPLRAIPAARREDSGLRMIGSLGRDRAEASGELAPMGSAGAAPSVSTQRELVTILPRRSTRELPIVAPDAPAPPEAKRPTTEELDDDDDAAGVEPVESPEERDREARHATEPGVRRTSGPRMALTVGLFVLAFALAGIATYLALRRPERKVAPPVDMNVVTDSPDATLPAPDAGLLAVGLLDDAAVPPAPIDAAPRPSVDASVALAPDARPAEEPLPHAPDPLKKARVLMDQASDAIKNAQYDEAISLADQSLRLRRTARTYLLKATALQRLNRMDEALVAMGEAVTLVPNYPPAFEQRGRLLWSLHRYDEARPDLELFLKLDPTSASAPQIQRMLSEPR